MYFYLIADSMNLEYVIFFNINILSFGDQF